MNNKNVIIYCCKRKLYKDGLLIKEIERKLFNSECELMDYYNYQIPDAHEKIEACVYVDCNQKTLAEKGEK